jgi:BolA protein
MRVLHTSDWHLGHQLHGVAREHEHAAFLAWLVEACVREAVDAVLLTGDVFDGSNPPAVAQAAYYGFLAALGARLPGARNSPGSAQPGESHSRSSVSYRPWNLCGRIRPIVVLEQPDENPRNRPMSGPVAREIEILLQEAFLPTRLDVINDSARHHGHSGDDGSGESHFTVVIESLAFAGKSRLERQRLVNRALGDIPGQRVHALAIKAFAPGEKVE